MCFLRLAIPLLILLCGCGKDNTRTDAPASTPARPVVATETTAAANAVAARDVFAHSSFLPRADPAPSLRCARAHGVTASGGFTGEGVGEGVQKVLYLPEAHTDMIFAVVGEELGLVGSALVIGGFGVFAFTGFRIALRCKDPF